MGLLGALTLFLLREEGDLVTIRRGEETLYTLPLDEDRDINVPAADGGYNLVRIRDGAVWMEAATCPGQDCVLHGPTTHTADPIICIPNRLEVFVSTENGLDGVTG